MSDGGKQKKQTSVGFHFLAGLGSGCASAALLQPADLLKTRIQQSQAGSIRQALRTVLDGPNPVRSLWRGTTPSVIRTGLGSALYFGMLNQMREYVSRMPAIPVPGLPTAGVGEGGSSSVLPKIGNVANLATGAAARVAAGFMMNPVTVLKVRYESTHYSYTSMAGAARDIMRTEGARGFFAGFGATAVRDAPYAGLYVLIYEQSKAQLANLSKIVPGSDGQPAIRSMGSNATINFMSGVLAATAATTLTNPFDAIKTRLQIAPGKYRNLVQAARTMLAEEGVRSMFYGLSLRIGRKAVSSALTWTVYEELIRRAESVVEDKVKVGA
ncbi:Putative mitochondrial carrier protein [Septoria linicola]|uniref:Mitochondrial glycine transporter n=1 Tax=Septoria linicola TaxID=215465 RepID=A0A9Q9ALD5_9PEZI|nr:putative mitochondrial carrier protein [Septoria linicola]USW48081.1 Putative mitochondrial carrier protein [Septoria linicola]